jgi:hypothetical protein
MRPRYIVVHCKHAGCYDYNFIEHRETKTRMIPITINTPKIFMFESKDEAREFFNEYMTDVDTVDARCKVGNEIKHVEFCTCGVIDLDEEEHPNLFYNRNNQIFLLEHTAQVFMTNQNIRIDINNMNISNNLMKRVKSMPEEQRRKYIDLGKMCQDCNLEGYLESAERERIEKQREDEKRAEDEKKKQIEEEKRRNEEIKIISNTIFNELEKMLEENPNALDALEEIRKYAKFEVNFTKPKNTQFQNVIITQGYVDPAKKEKKAEEDALAKARALLQKEAEAIAQAKAAENIVLSSTSAPVKERKKYTRKPKTDV